MESFKSPASGIEITDDDIPVLIKKLKRLGKGVYRQVFEIDEEFVLKYGEIGINEREWNLWITTQDSRLTPVVFISENREWLIMQRVEPLHPQPEHSHNADCDKCKEVDKREWKDFIVQCRDELGIDDLHIYNLGIWKGQKVVLDYGGWG